MDAYYAALKIVHVYGAVSVLPFRCVYPHFLLELFHVQRLDLFWHTGSWAPLVSACSDYSFSNSPVFDWVTRGLQLWERNDGLVVNVSNSWQLLFVRGRASQDEQVATAYLPMLLGRTPPTSLPFSETRFYVWTCIFAYTHNSKKKKKFPLSPLAPPLKLPAFVSDVPFPGVLLDQALGLPTSLYYVSQNWAGRTVYTLNNWLSKERTW